MRWKLATMAELAAGRHTSKVANITTRGTSDDRRRGGQEAEHGARLAGDHRFAAEAAPASRAGGDSNGRPWAREKTT